MAANRPQADVVAVAFGTGEVGPDLVERGVVAAAAGERRGVELDSGVALAADEADEAAARDHVPEFHGAVPVFLSHESR
jgi:hypothetical protein